MENLGIIPRFHGRGNTLQSSDLSSFIHWSTSDKGGPKRVSKPTAKSREGPCELRPKCTVQNREVESLTWQHLVPELILDLAIRALETLSVDQTKKKGGAEAAFP